MMPHCVWDAQSLKPRNPTPDAAGRTLRRAMNKMVHGLEPSTTTRLEGFGRSATPIGITGLYEATRLGCCRRPVVPSLREQQPCVSDAMRRVMDEFGAFTLAKALPGKRAGRSRCT